MLATKALGLKNCPFNADVFVRDGKVWIIEIGGRTGATCIPELISIYKGYDWYEKIIRAALGENLDFTSEKEIPCMAKLLFSEKDGVIQSIDRSIIEELTQMGMEIHLDYKEGEHIDAVHNGTDRIGHLIKSETTEEQIDNYVKQVMNAIEI